MKKYQVRITFRAGTKTESYTECPWGLEESQIQRFLDGWNFNPETDTYDIKPWKPWDNTEDLLWYYGF